jgi:hypothetical protein
MMRRRGGQRASVSHVRRDPLRPGGLDRFDLGVLLCLAGLSLGFLVWIFVRGGVFGGWEGYVVADQGQYLAWIREAGEHVLMANRFDMRPNSHVYLQPALLLSGLLYALGVSAPIAYLLWKPVAVAVLFAGSWAYVRRTLDATWERRVALVLALFLVSPLAVLSPLWGESGRGAFDFVSGEIWPPGHLWGYPFGAIATGLAPLVFLCAERVLRAGSGSERRRWTAYGILGGLLASSLHPWQGAIVVGVLGAAALWHVLAGELTAGAAARLLGPVAAAPLVPATYYFLLARLDASWEITDTNYSQPLEWGLTWRTGLLLAPLLVPALAAYRRRPAGFQDRVLLLWAPVVGLLYLIPATPVRFHVFNGVSIPLAILTVRALAPYAARPAARRRRGTVAAGVAAACALLILPGTFDRIRSARGAVYLNEQPYLLEPGERDALDALERLPDGGVMAPVNLAALVPYRSGQETWVATPSWSPDFGERAAAVANLFAGRLAPPDARRLVEDSGVRFVLADCHVRTDLRPALEPIAEARSFGCAILYEVREPRAGSGGDL